MVIKINVLVIMFIKVIVLVILVRIMVIKVIVLVIMVSDMVLVREGCKKSKWKF